MKIFNLKIRKYNKKILWKQNPFFMVKHVKRKKYRIYDNKYENMLYHKII